MRVALRATKFNAMRCDLLNSHKISVAIVATANDASYNVMCKGCKKIYLPAKNETESKY